MNIHCVEYFCRIKSYTLSSGVKKIMRLIQFIINQSNRGTLFHSSTTEVLRVYVMRLFKYS
jgi:hypothetical protein